MYAHAYNYTYRFSLAFKRLLFLAIFCITHQITSKRLHISLNRCMISIDCLLDSITRYNFSRCFVFFHFVLPNPTSNNNIQRKQERFGMTIYRQVWISHRQNFTVIKWKSSFYRLNSCCYYNSSSLSSFGFSRYFENTSEIKQLNSFFMCLHIRTIWHFE